MSSKDYTKFPEGKEGNSYYDALTDAELRKALMSVPETSTSRMTRREKDLYNAGVRRSYKRNKEGKFFYLPEEKNKINLPPKGSSTLSNEPTKRGLTEEQAKAILTSAIKSKNARYILNNLKDRDYFYQSYSDAKRYDEDINWNMGNKVA
jgi:hypothetical protein